jgi:hypothetical protein
LVCLCARQYSLVDHANALNDVFPAVRARNVSLVIGSSLNAGFISGSPRYNYGKDNFRIHACDLISLMTRMHGAAGAYLALAGDCRQPSSLPRRGNHHKTRRRLSMTDSTLLGRDLRAGTEPGRDSLFRKDATAPAGAGARWRR